MRTLSGHALRYRVSDPVWRRWLWLWMTGRAKGYQTFTPHRPPYLGGTWKGVPREEPASAFPSLAAETLSAAVDLPLAGSMVRLEPGHDLYATAFPDPEMERALHQFAWMPLIHDTLPPDRFKAVVLALWQAWKARFAASQMAARTTAVLDSWHPAIAAERVVNMLAFVRRYGVPAPENEPKNETVRLLAAHGPAIAARLDYHGERGTSSTLAGNGRGLFLLGLALGLPACAGVGGRILTEEARRLFHPSGVLREGSTHYHLLLTRTYVEAWAAALAHRRPEEPALRAALIAALRVVPSFVLPGGLPLVGDCAPDCPPEHLAGLFGGFEGGWLGWLSAEDRTAFLALRATILPADGKALRIDGWLRADFGPWSGLWHAPTEGWVEDHGHQDLGACELHYQREAVWVDPGGGARAKEKIRYRSGAAHGLLSIDDEDPSPYNHPWYDGAFRHLIHGYPPRLTRTDNTVTLRRKAFMHPRGGKTVGPLVRIWRFAGGEVSVEDHVETTAPVILRRRLVTPLVVAPPEDDGSIVLVGRDGRRYRVVADAPLRRYALTRFTGYGRRVPASVLEIVTQVHGRWLGRVRLVAL